MSYCTTRAFEVQAFFKFGPLSYKAVNSREWVMGTSLYCIFCRVLNKNMVKIIVFILEFHNIL